MSSRRPSMPAQPCTTRARCNAKLLSPPAGPHLSAFLFIFFAPTHQPPARPEADSVGRSGPGGHARGMALVPPCATLTQPHATVGCIARLPTARCRSPLEAWSLAIKRPRSLSLSLSTTPPPCSICQTTQHEGRGEERNKEGGAAAGRRTGSTPKFGAPPRIKLERTTSRRRRDRHCVNHTLHRLASPSTVR